MIMTAMQMRVPKSPYWSEKDNIISLQYYSITVLYIKVLHNYSIIVLALQFYSFNINIEITYWAVFSPWAVFRVNFFERKKNLVKNFVRESKYTKISVFSCILSWNINFENPFIRFKTAMFCSKSSRIENF